MKTLNKTLSLVLVLVMVLGLFGVASAADFKDKAEIENVEAVNTMAALNIINGKNGNVFDPTGTVTRAEMSKMICVALNGGKEPVLGTTANPTYSDIQGHWAAGYIEYCSTLGIVAGMGDGTFAPDATVTGSQAAKMMLVAMNYKADVFGFTGPAWETRVNVEANKAGLYADLGGLNASEGLSRDNAAQLIYNGIFAGMMQLSWQQNANGEITQTYQLNTTKTIANEKFDLEVAFAKLTEVKYDSVDKEYDTTFVAATVENQVDDRFNNAVACDVDYSDYFMMNVKVLFSEDVNGNIKVYGVYPHKSSVVLAGVVGQLADAHMDSVTNTVKLNGTTYKFLNLYATPVYDFNVVTPIMSADPAHPNYATGANSARTGGTNTLLGYYTTATTAAGAVLAAYSFKALDTNGDGKIDTLVVYPFTVHEVTYVGSKTATMNTAPICAAAADSSIVFEDDVVYDGIAKGDFVKKTASVNSVNNADTFEKIMPMSGKVTKTTTVGLLTKVQMNGIYFPNITGSAMSIGSTYEDVAQVNTFIFFATLAASSVNGEGYAMATTGNVNNDYSQPVAKFLFSDGTVKEVILDASGLTTITQDTFYQYTVLADGTYKVEAATETPGAYDGKDTTSSSFNGATATRSANVSGKTISDTAVVFVKDTAGNYKVITGAEAKKLSGGSITNKGAFYNTNVKTGFSTVELLCLVLTGSVQSGTENYGYITGDIVTFKNDAGQTRYEVTFWNGTEEVTKIAKTISSTLPAAKGAIFEYTYNADGEMIIDEVTGLTYTEVTAYDGTAITFKAGVSNAKMITDKTVVFYVDSEAKKGVEGGSIQLAQAGVENVFVLDCAGGSEHVAFLVVDVNNEMADMNFVTLTSANPSATEINAALAAYAQVNVAGTLPDSGITVPAGKKLVVVNGQTTAKLEAVAGVATATLELKDESSDANYAGTGVQFYTDKGAAQSGAGGNGTQATEVTASAKIPGGTYVYGQLGYSTVSLDDPDLSGWFK